MVREHDGWPAFLGERDVAVALPRSRVSGAAVTTTSGRRAAGGRRRYGGGELVIRGSLATRGPVRQIHVALDVWCEPPRRWCRARL